MKTILGLSVLGAIAVAVLAAPGPLQQTSQTMLSHDVFFKLRDASPAAKEKLVAACQKYLADHPGTVWFAAGVVADEFKREVNVRDYDVALHVVFADKAAHDLYQTAAKHEQFIEENKENWESVRVFDSWVKTTARKARQ